VRRQWLVEQEGPAQLRSTAAEAHPSVRSLDPHLRPQQPVRLVLLDDARPLFIPEQNQPRPHRIAIRISERLEDHMRWGGLVAGATAAFDHRESVEPVPSQTLASFLEGAAG